MFLQVLGELHNVTLSIDPLLLIMLICLVRT